MVCEMRVPESCTATQLEAFCRLVRQEGQVNTAGLEGRVARAQTLVLLFDDAVLAGTAAIKRPTDRYRRKVFRRAAVSENAVLYLLELGWVVVDKPYRKRKLSRQLVETALKSCGEVPVFATSRSDNTKMHKTLQRFRFTTVGSPYQSEEEDTRLILFVRNPRVA